MGAWLRLLLVVAHLGAVAAPCPAPALPADGDRTPELHAVCHCGCEEAPPATRIAQLSAALLPVAILPDLPRAEHAGAPTLAPASAPSHTPEPVPRSV